MSSRKGQGRFWLVLAGLAAAACALWAAYLALAFSGFHADPVWYLEPARNFARGWGLVTRILYPAQVAYFPAPLDLPVPPLHHGPLALLALGLAYKVFGVSDWVPLAYSYGLTLLAGAAAARLARRVAGDRAGWLAAALYWTNMMVIEDGVGALTDPLFTVLITIGAGCLWLSQEERPAGGWLALAGLFLGLASATRLAGQAYWLGFFAAAWYLHRRPGALLELAAGWALPMAGLALYNHAVAGVLFYSPGIYILLWSKTFPGFRSSTSYLKLTTLEAVLAYPRDILTKMATGPLYAAQRFLESAHAPYFAALVALASVWRFDARPAARLRAFALILTAPVLLVNVVISYGAVHYLSPLFPLLAAVAAAACLELLEERTAAPKHPWATAAIMSFLLLSPAALSLKDAYKARPRALAEARDRAAFGVWLSGLVPEEKVIYTDDPPAVVWEADRSGVALPATMTDAEKTFAHLKPDALVLTSRRVDSADYAPEFDRAFKAKAPILGFTPCGEFESETLTAALYLPGACRK